MRDKLNQIREDFSNADGETIKYILKEFFDLGELLDLEDRTAEELIRIETMLNEI